MKTVALLVIYVGYSLVVYGVDHIMGNCTPFSCCILGQFAGGQCATTSGSITCQPTTATTPTTSSAGNTVVPATSLPTSTPGTKAVTGTYTAPATPGTSTYGGSQPGTFVTNPGGSYITSVPFNPNNFAS